MASGRVIENEPPSGFLFSSAVPIQREGPAGLLDGSESDLIEAVGLWSAKTPSGTGFKLDG